MKVAESLRLYVSNLCFYSERLSKHQVTGSPPAGYFGSPVVIRLGRPLPSPTTERITGPPGKMHRLMLVFVAVAGASAFGLPGLGVSPAAEPCDAPLQWEGKWVVYDHSTGRNSRAAVSYDGQNQRIRVLQQHKKHTPCQRYKLITFLRFRLVIFNSRKCKKK